jgi:glycosyltransferase involved in cell wall biosynthesis
MDRKNKKKVLIIQENGHHAPNRDFRECFSLKRAIETYQVDADVWGKGHENFARPLKSIVDDYDAVISLENYDTGWHPDLSEIKIPKAFWCIDAHMGLERYLNFVKQNRFDLVFNSTRKFVHDFKPITSESIWLPNAYDSFLIDKLFNIPKTTPLGFCGNVVNRGQMIAYLKKRYGLKHDRMVIGQDMVRAVNSYQIHWNQNISVDINYRNFETLGCGTFLLTNYVPDLESLFNEDEHICVYRKKREVDEKLDFYLNHANERESMANRGNIHVKKHHTYINRAKTILKKLGVYDGKQLRAMLPSVVDRVTQNPINNRTFLYVIGENNKEMCITKDAGCSNRQLKAASEKNNIKSVPITVVTETLNYVSGGVRCIVEVLNRLAKRGYDVSCYVTQSDLKCEWLEIDFPVLPIKEFYKYKGIAISSYSPTAEMVARSNAIGKFYWVHSYEPKFPELTGRSDKWRIMSEASYRFDQLHYFTVSTYVKMILELIYGRKVLSPLVPGGVDIDLFKPGEKKDGPLKIMFLSREHRFRGAPEILRALNQVHDEGLDINAFVMGTPIDMGDLPHVHHPPLPQAEFAALLGEMDIFIHASHFEGLPLPPLEAMACGCAVIATDIGASDYLLDGFNAFVVPPKKPAKIAEAVRLLAADGEMRIRLQELGTQTVRRNYTWERTADRILEALAEGMACQNTNQDLATLQEPSLSVQAFNKAPPIIEDDTSAYLVSAIVSAYNSERFLRGCLEDLEAQTLADQLEIVIVNSGSQQNEEAIVRQFQKRYQNITYLKTEQRETVYQAWNRAIRIAKGKYLTNANTDDRHAPHALEYMTKILEVRPEIALVYADVWITENENDTYDHFTPSGKYQWRDFDPVTLIDQCYIGPQPMWRKRLHAKYGLFDDQLQSAGDWEFWLRIAKKEGFSHVPKLLGLYLNSPTSIEHRDPDLVNREIALIRHRYRQFYGLSATNGD